MLCRKTIRLLLYSVPLVWVGCGYRWHYDYPGHERPTLAVPFIPGDEDGSLTSEIVSRLETSGIVDVTARSGDLRLDVQISQIRSDQIGYRRDPQKIKQQIQKNLLASEQRKTLDAIATIFRKDTDEIVYGPYRISVSSDYDFVDGDSYQDLTFIDASGALVEVLPFSLGQLEAIDSAQEAATKPLYRKLAQKIVDAISAEW